MAQIPSRELFKTSVAQMQLGFHTVSDALRGATLHRLAQNNVFGR